MRRGLALIIAASLACKGEHGEEPAPGPAPPCASLACETAGVPADGCAEGFISDGARGCTPVLPAEPCTDNEYAVPGSTVCRAAGVDTCPVGFEPRRDGCATRASLSCESSTIATLDDESCRPIAPCGTDRFPKTSSPTIFVDSTYPGTDSDGSATRPFLALADAIARIDGARRTIALAAGAYEFAGRITAPVEIVGVCPDRTFVSAPKAATTPVVTLAADVTLRGLDISGPLRGVVVEKGTTKIIGTYVHATGAEGIVAEPGTTLELEGSVIGRTMDSGVSLRGATARILRSEIRSTSFAAGGTNGIAVRAVAALGRPSTVVIDRTVVDRNARHGIFSLGSDVTVRDSLIARTSAVATTGGGAIISVQSKLSLSGTLLQDNHAVGVGGFGGALTLDRVSIRGTRLGPSSAAAVSLGLDPSSRKPCQATITRSTVADSDDMGVLVTGAVADIGDTVVRSTRPVDLDPAGRPVVVELAGSTAPNVTFHDSLIEDGHVTGIVATAGTTTVDRVAIRNIKALKQTRGWGALVFTDNPRFVPTMTIRRSLIEHVREAGAAAFAARLEVEGTVIRSVTQRETNGVFGHGVHFSYEHGAARGSEGHVRGCAISDVFEAGINVFMSNVEIDSTTIASVRANPSGVYGDGITVASVNAELHHPAAAVIRRTRISDVARAAISVFEAEVAASGLLGTCNAFDIAVETVVGKQETKLRDEGENRCGCDVLRACRAASSGLEPIGR